MSGYQVSVSSLSLLWKHQDTSLIRTPFPSSVMYRMLIWCVCVCVVCVCHIVAQESKSITVTLPDGKTVSGQSWQTTPYNIASGISKGLADNTVIAKVYNVRVPILYTYLN